MKILYRKEARMPPKGKMIVLEGCEGAGKSSCLEFLRLELRSRSDIVFTSTPNKDTNFGESVRNLLLHTDMHPEAELLLFLAMHRQFVEDIVAPAIRTGKHVICDRFLLSTYAYQMCGRELGDSIDCQAIFTRVSLLIYNMLDMYPCYIFMDISPSIGLKRKEKQNDLNRFEGADLAFHERVRDGFKEGVVNYTTYLVDANNKKEVVQQKVLKIVQKELT